ncbi:CepA family extended-spectrum class A beta-lactamase [Spirosoma koreense]
MLLLAGLFSMFSPVYAQISQLQTKIEQVFKGRKATVGVGIYDFSHRQTLTIQGDKHMAMQSVYKFHVALAMLKEVDKGRFKLTQKMHVRKSDMISGLHSPMREAYPNGEVDLSLADIIRYSVADSDGSACDYLFRLLGGPKQVDAFIHQLGIRDVAIRDTEAKMQAPENWDVQYNNWTTPTAMLDLLKLFYQRRILSASSHAFLWKLMAETTTGQNRLRKLLPAGTVVAHKTGTSVTTKDGLTGAVNDVGFIMMPNGEPIAISVFIMNSTESTETNERIIADIAKLAYDHFAKAN